MYIYEKNMYSEELDTVFFLDVSIRFKFCLIYSFNLSTKLLISIITFVSPKIPT